MQLDVTSGDLSWSDRGDLVVPSDPLSQAVYLRVMTERGSLFWDTTFGSRLHELRRTKLDVTFKSRLEDVLREALTPLVAAGELAKLSFDHERQAGGRWHVRVRAQTRSRRDFTFPLFVEVT